MSVKSDQNLMAGSIRSTPQSHSNIRIRLLLQWTSVLGPQITPQAEHEQEAIPLGNLDAESVNISPTRDNKDHRFERDGRVVRTAAEAS